MLICLTILETEGVNLYKLKYISVNISDLGSSCWVVSTPFFTDSSDMTSLASTFFPLEIYLIITNMSILCLNSCLLTPSGHKIV